MIKTVLKTCFLSLVIIQGACADDSDKAADTDTMAPATGISTSTAESETGVLLQKAADNVVGSVTLEALRKAIDEQLPGMPIDSLTVSPVGGVFELVTEGQIYYINDDATFLMTGNMIELATQTNLTEQRLGGLHMDLLASVDEKNKLIYKASEPSDRFITVFTDISCGYCRLLHEQIDTLLNAGVNVQYLLFPRAGLGSTGHQALESVWCADDPLEAMTTAKAGGQVPESSCSNPIESHVQIAQEVGLRGTPLIYLDTGERVHGYREAAVLAEMVNAGQPYKEH